MSAVRPEGTGTMDSNAVTSREYVTATIGGQLFGLPILRVQDVFIPERVTRSGMKTSCTRRIGRPNNCPPIVAVTYSREAPACSTCAAAS